MTTENQADQFNEALFQEEPPIQNKQLSSEQFAGTQPLDLTKTPFPGFTLERLELLNWGTFHQEIWTLETNGGATMIVGENGCGKTSAGDALLALLVPERGAGARFNSAGVSAKGGQKGRDLTTYITGEYSNTTSETGRSKALMLRPPNSGYYTVILAVFKNDYTQSVVSLAWLMQARAEEGKSYKRYMYAEPRELSIANHFTKLGGKNLIDYKNAIKEQFGIVPCDESYWVKVRALLGLSADGQSQRLFAKGISTKEIHSFTDFARTLMLEESTDVMESVNRAVNHFADLEASYNAARIAEEKSLRLHQIQANHTALTVLDADLERNRNLSSEVPGHFCDWRVAAIDATLKLAEITLDEKEGELKKAQESKREKSLELDSIKQQINEKGGGLVSELRRRKSDLEAKAATTLRRKQELEKLLSACNIAAPISAPAFENLFREVIPGKIDAQETQLESLSNQISKLYAEKIHPLEKEIQECLDELASLEGKNSNIDRRRLAIRDQMAADLGLSPSQLPFFGELVQVKATSTSWAPAIERALKGISQDILVPEKYERDARRWNESMEKKGIRGIIQTLKIPERFEDSGEKGSFGYLPEKLEFDTSSYACGWVKATIQRDFNYLCTENEDEYDSSPKALSKTGQTKSMRHRTSSYRKDTREALGSNNFLGWNNDQKKAGLRRKIEDLRGEINEFKIDENRLKETRKKVTGEQNAFKVMTEGIPSYASIDIESVSQEQSEVEATLKKLEAGNDALAVLTKNATMVEQRINEIEQEVAELNRRIGEGTKNIETLNNKKRKLLDEQIMPTYSESIVQGIAQAIEACGIELDMLTETSLAADQVKVSAYFSKKIEALRDSKNKTISLIREGQSNFLHQYKDHPGLLVGIENFGDWVRVIEELREAAMDSFKLKLRERFGTGVITDLNTVANTINAEKNRIKDGLEQLNATLRHIPYDAKLNTYIKLQSYPSKDPLVEYFRDELQQCLNIRTDFTVTLTDDQYLEHFKKVRDFMAKLADPIKFQRETSQKGAVLPVKIGEDWLVKVTDLRNWYAFNVTEHHDANDELHYDHQNTHKKSGGENQKITYSLIGAAFLYNYRLGEVLQYRKKGINDPTVFGAKRFRTIMIDESFNNMDPDNVKFAVGLLRSLGLQPLIVSPYQHMAEIAPTVQSVCLVVKEQEKFSKIRNIGIEEFRQEHGV